MESINFSTYFRPKTFSEVVGQDLVKSTLIKIAQAPGISVRSIFLKGSFGSGKCIDLDQRVSTSKGYLKGRDLVKNLPEGFTTKIIEVEQSDGTYQETSHLFFQKGVKTLTVKTFYGKEFSATPEHPVLALKEGTLVPKMIKVSELKEGDFILYRKPMLSFSFRKENTGEYLKYFLYGYCIGDACYSGRDKVQIRGTYDDMKWLSSYLRAQGMLRNDGKDYAITKDKRATDCVQIQIPYQSKGFLSLLTLGENAYTKTLNESVFSSKEIAFATFAGLLASDGSLTQSRIASIRKRGLKKSPGIEYSTSSLNLSNDICDLLDYLGIIYSVSKRSTKFSYKGELRAGKDSYRIIIPSSFIKEVYLKLKEFGTYLDLPHSRMSRVFNFNVEDSKQQVSKCSYSSPLRNKFWEWFNSKFNPQICRGNSTEPCQLCIGGRKRSYNNSFNCSYYSNFKRNLPNTLSPVTIANACQFLIDQGVKLTDNKFLTEDIKFNVSLYRDYVYSPILSIKESTCDVFDVTIPTTHLFMSGNRVNHNTTVSKIFGKALNCTQFQKLGDVCNECDPCKEASSSNSQLYLEFDSSVIGNVEAIKALTERLSYTPNGRRLVVFDECHAVSRQAMNTLLKVIEDGIPNTIFMFCSTEDILPTIKSRSLCLDITTIPFPLIEQRLKQVCDKLNISVPQEHLSQIAIKSKGHMRNALSDLQLYTISGPESLKTCYPLIVKFHLLCLSNHKEEALNMLSQILLYPSLDIRDSILLFLRNVYLSDKDSQFYKLLQSGVINKLFSFYYSPVAQQAIKDEFGIELLLRSLLEKLCK